MARWDTSFIREGKTLLQWLPDLVAENRQTQFAAGEAIYAMGMGIDSVHSELTGLEGIAPGRKHTAQFEQAMEQSIRDLPLPWDDYVLKLAVHLIRQREAWLKHCDFMEEEREAYEKRTDPLLQKIAPELAQNPKDARREQLLSRMHKVICSMPDCSTADGFDDKVMNFDIVVHQVIENAGDRLLETPEVVQLMLDVDGVAYVAEKALMKLGPKASQFAGHYLKQLDAVTEDSPYFNYAALLARLGEGVPQVIDALGERLGSEQETIRFRAAGVLSHMAPHLAGQGEKLFDQVNQLFQSAKDEKRYYFYDAWASLGRARPEVRQQVLAETLPRPPRMKISDEHGHRWEYDEVAHERGRAIDACKYFVNWPDETVPVLSQSLGNFEEYDPDNTYNGGNERVCWVLRDFKSQAVSALPRIIELLEAWLTRQQDDGVYPKDLLGVITAMGPVAQAALPVLHKIRHSEERDNAPLEEFSPVDEAILSVLPSALEGERRSEGHVFLPSPPEGEGSGVRG